jgi:hypothetical protein
MTSFTKNKSLTDFSEEQSHGNLLRSLNINYGNAMGYNLCSMSIGDLKVSQSQVGVQRRRQRKYLFNDVLGGPGHPWQRNLFASLLVGNPIGIFEATLIGQDKSNQNEERMLIEDGQQRYYTTMAILDNKIKLPNNMREYGKQYEQYANKLFKDLHPDLRERIFSTEFIFSVSRLKSESERYKRFIDINKSNKLSDQDKRSGQPSSGAEYIQYIVDGNNKIEYGSYKGSTTPPYDMFLLSSAGDKIEHTYIEPKPNGRTAEEIVANWYSYYLYNGTADMNTDCLNRMYKQFLDEPDTITETDKHNFENYLSLINEMVVKYSSRKKLTKKPLDYLFPVVKKMMDSGKNINTDVFMKYYIKAIDDLRNENPVYTPQNNPKQKQQMFDYVFRQMNNRDAIQYVVEQIYNKMCKSMSL